MRKVKYLMGVGLLAAALLMGSGCGLVGSTENIEAGMTAVAAEDYATALTCFAAAEEAGENKRLLYRGRGLCLMAQTQYEEAVAAFRQALGLSNGIPDDIDYDLNYYMAAALYKTGRAEEAAAVYDAILAMREKDSNALFLRGAIRVEQGGLAEGRADFDQVLLLDSRNSERLIEIYLILSENGFKEAGQEYLQAALEDETKKLTDFEMGRIYYYLADYENAKNYLEQARDSSFQAVLFLGKTYEVLGDYNYAVSVYDSYLGTEQGSPQIYNQLGMCRLKMQDYAAALSAFQAGKEIEENDILQTLRFNEIVAYEYLGEYRRAAVLMEEYLQSYPEDAAAARENVFLQSR